MKNSLLLAAFVLAFLVLSPVLTQALTPQTAPDSFPTVEIFAADHWFFTPNGDGLNDKALVTLELPTDFCPQAGSLHLRVYSDANVIAEIPFTQTSKGGIFSNCKYEAAWDGSGMRGERYYELRPAFSIGRTFYDIPGAGTEVFASKTDCDHYSLLSCKSACRRNWSWSSLKCEPRLTPEQEETSVWGNARINSLVADARNKLTNADRAQLNSKLREEKLNSFIKELFEREIASIQNVAVKYGRTTMEWTADVPLAYYDKLRNAFVDKDKLIKEADGLRAMLNALNAGWSMSEIQRECTYSSVKSFAERVYMRDFAPTKKEITYENANDLISPCFPEPRDKTGKESNDKEFYREYLSNTLEISILTPEDYDTSQPYSSYHFAALFEGKRPSGLDKRTSNVLNGVASAAALIGSSSDGKRMNEVLELARSSTVFSQAVRLSKTKKYDPIQAQKELLQVASDYYNKKNYGQALISYYSVIAQSAGIPYLNYFGDFAKQRANNIAATKMPKYFKSGLYSCLVGLTDVRFLVLGAFSGALGKTAEQALHLGFTLSAVYGFYEQGKALSTNKELASNLDAYVSLACSGAFSAGLLKPYAKQFEVRPLPKKVTLQSLKGMILDTYAKLGKSETPPSLNRKTQPVARTAERASEIEAGKDVPAFKDKSNTWSGPKKLTDVNLEDTVTKKMQEIDQMHDRTTTEGKKYNEELLQRLTSSKLGPADSAKKVLHEQSKRYLDYYSQNANFLSKLSGQQFEETLLKTIDAMVDEYAIEGGKLNKDKFLKIDALTHKMVAAVSYLEHVASGQKYSSHTFQHLYEDWTKIHSFLDAFKKTNDKDFLNKKQTVLIDMIVYLHDLGYADKSIVYHPLDFKDAKNHPEYSANFIAQQLQQDLREIIGEKSADFIKENFRKDINEVVGLAGAAIVEDGVQYHGNKQKIRYDRQALADPVGSIKALFALADDLAVDKVPPVFSEHPELASIMIDFYRDYESKKQTDSEFAKQVKLYSDKLNEYVKLKTTKPDQAAHVYAELIEMDRGNTLLGKFRNNYRKRMLKALNAYRKKTPAVRYQQYVKAVQYSTENDFLFAIAPAIIEKTSISSVKVGEKPIIEVTITISAPLYNKLKNVVGQEGALSQVAKIVTDLIERGSDQVLSKEDLTAKTKDILENKAGYFGENKIIIDFVQEKSNAKLFSGIK